MRKSRLDVVIIKPLWFVQSAPHLGRPRTTPVDDSCDQQPTYLEALQLLSRSVTSHPGT